MKLPRKLGKEPLIEAVFEVRFTAMSPASNILPGLLLAKLTRTAGIQRLPAANLPQPIRDSDPNLMYAPIIRVGWPPFTVLISDRSLGVASAVPYVGWAKFKPAILSVVDATMEETSISSVQRIALKYTDLVSAEVGDIHAILQTDPKIGENSLTKVQVRAQVLKGGYTHIIQIASDVTATLPDATTREGLAIDVDTIQEFANRSHSEFVKAFPDDLKRLHHANKEMFFTSLRPEILEKLEPEYE
jgi:uncharacterized protein (TIGR04255 family)